MMTREQALKLLEYPIYKWSMDWDEREDGLNYSEAIELAISALRPVSREQVEKMKSPWKSYFNGDYNDEIYYCEECGHKLESASRLPNFCPDCGVPKTDEAVEMVMERLRVLTNDN